MWKRFIKKIERVMRRLDYHTYMLDLCYGRGKYLDEE